MESDMAYRPPTLLADQNDRSITNRMLSNLPEDIDKTEGGFAFDFIRPAALEKAELMFAINMGIQACFPQWSYGIYLDQLAAGIGLARKSASAAIGSLIIIGVPGTVIPAGARFATATTALAASVEFDSAESVTLDGNGNAVIPIVCTTPGKQGNIPADSIHLMTSPIGGVMTITNPQPTTGGSETETDDALRLRIIEKDRSGESSSTGCDADYKRWAKEVDGIGTAIVVPEWQGAGSGTVKVIVMDSNGQPASTALIEAVYNHILSPDDRDERLAPIGAIVTVTTCYLLTIDISATVALEEGQTIENVTTTFQERLKTYFEEAKTESSVRYTRIGSVLSETPGILDYGSLLVNEGTMNIPITVDNYPIIGTITLTEAT